MGSKQRTATTERRVKIARADLLPSYHYPEPRGARAEEEAKRRRSRNETWLQDYPTPEFHNLRDVSDEWTKATSRHFSLVGKPDHGQQLMWIDTGAMKRDGETKVTPVPVDTIDGWRSQGKMESEYQATMYNPKKPPTKAVKEKRSDTKKTHSPDVPTPRVPFTAVRCSSLSYYDVTPGPNTYDIPEIWPFH